jgi:hypothetical protein
MQETIPAQIQNLTSFQVPMDWNDTSAGAKVAIAITKIPAKVDVVDPRYGGAILINPGLRSE